MVNSVTKNYNTKIDLIFVNFESYNYVGGIGVLLQPPQACVDCTIMCLNLLSTKAMLSMLWDNIAYILSH